MIAGNRVGTDLAGQGIFGNLKNGFQVSGGKNNTIANNVIAVNVRNGVKVSGGATGLRIERNEIGTDVTGTRPGNSKSGIEVLKGATSLGRGSMIIDSNVIGGNGKHGIWYHGPRDEWHGGLDFASGNAIGVTNCELHPNKFVFGPPTAIPNALDGIYISHEANHIVIEENCIWFSGRDGVRVDGQDAVKNWIPNNSIHGNQGKGIENINGGNTELPPPQIIAGPNGPNGSFGDVVGTTCSNCLVELFSDSGGEGRTPLGEVDADSGGVFSFSGLVAIIPGDKITCTATGERQNTSEFGCDIVAPSVDLSVTKTDTILEGPELTPGGSIEYTVRITNNSSDPVPDMPRNEFEDAIPLGASYVLESIVVDGLPSDDDPTDGTGYEADEDRVIWNGVIPGNSTVVIRFRVQTDTTLRLNSEVRNQGMILGALKSDDSDTAAVDDPTVTPVTVLATDLSVETFTADPGRGGTVTFDTSSPPVGTYTAWLMIDAKAQVTETDADNNVSSEDYVVSDLSDLSVSSFVASVNENSVTFDFEICNMGPAVGPFHYRIWKHRDNPPGVRDSDWDQSSRIAQLSEGCKSFSTDIPGLPQGDFTGWLLVDARGKVNENNEENNAASDQYSIGDASDLYVKSLDPVATGNRVKVNCEICTEDRLQDHSLWVSG